MERLDIGIERRTLFMPQGRFKGVDMLPVHLSGSEAVRKSIVLYRTSIALFVPVEEPGPIHLRIIVTCFILSGRLLLGCVEDLASSYAWGIEK